MKGLCRKRTAADTAAGRGVTSITFMSFALSFRAEQRISDYFDERYSKADPEMFRFAQHDKNSRRAPRFAGRLKRQRLKNVLQAVVDNDFPLQIRQDGLHRFEIQTSARYFWGFPVLGEQ
jgi:hypothetical protein